MQFLYGTAWKEERTEALTAQALAAGFRGFDTANQRKHYFEEGVGLALVKGIAAGAVTRADLFLQTKFTYQRGQDHRLPYDPKAPVDRQVRQSFASSLEHLGTTYLDAYLIHGPEHGEGLTQNDWSAWRVMEELHDQGKIRQLGISNVSTGQVIALAAGARVKPTYVQNRCYPSIAWDIGTREQCQRLGIIYQGFNLIRDPLVGKSAAVAAIAKRLGATTPQVIYRFAMQAGMLPLTGTTDLEHGKQALAAAALTLQPADMAIIAGLGA